MYGFDLCDPHPMVYIDLLFTQKYSGIFLNALLKAVTNFIFDL